MQLLTETNIEFTVELSFQAGDFFYNQLPEFWFMCRSNGEMDIDLSIFTKGGVDMYTSKIADNDDSVEPQELVRQLQERISELRQQVFKQDERFTEEIRGQQILNTAGDNNSNIQLSSELKRELRKTLQQLNGNPSQSAKELRDALIKLYGTDGTNGEARTLVDDIAKRVNDKISVLKGPSKTPDPFLDPKNFTDGLKSGEKSEQFVSLSKLVLLLVATFVKFF